MIRMKKSRPNVESVESDRGAEGGYERYSKKVMASIQHCGGVIQIRNLLSTTTWRRPSLTLRPRGPPRDVFDDLGLHYGRVYDISLSRIYSIHSGDLKQK